MYAARKRLREIAIWESAFPDGESAGGDDQGIFIWARVRVDNRARTAISSRALVRRDYLDASSRRTVAQ